MDAGIRFDLEEKPASPVAGDFLAGMRGEGCAASLAGEFVDFNFCDFYVIICRRIGAGTVGRRFFECRREHAETVGMIPA
jgi:hypothetical protein